MAKTEAAPAAKKSKQCCPSPILSAFGIPRKRTGFFDVPGKTSREKKSLWNVSYNCAACGKVVHLQQRERPETLTKAEVEVKEKAEAEAKAKEEAKKKAAKS